MAREWGGQPLALYGAYANPATGWLFAAPAAGPFSALILCGLLMLFSFTSGSSIEVGVLYAFISYLGRLNEPLIELTTQQSMLQQAVVAGERVFRRWTGLVSAMVTMIDR